MNFGTYLRTLAFVNSAILRCACLGSSVCCFCEFLYLVEFCQNKYHLILRVVFSLTIKRHELRGGNNSGVRSRI